MLSIPNLYTDLTNAVSGVTDSYVFCNKFANTLQTYLLNNVQINGIYSGVTNVGSPDPLCGSYIWKPISVLFSDIILFNGICNMTLINNPMIYINSWINTGLQSITFNGPDVSSKIITSIPSLSINVYSNINVNMIDKFINLWNTICTTIINSLIGLNKIMPISVPSISVSGSGTVNFTNIF